MTGGLRIVVCHDQRAVRESLGFFLAAQRGVRSLALAASADEALRLVRAGADVLVLDLQLTGAGDGLDVLEAMRYQGLSMPVLAVGAVDDVDLIVRAVGLGALGFCRTDASAADLADAVGRVAAGQSVIPDVLLGQIMGRLELRQRQLQDDLLLLHRLSPRELTVLRLLVEGLTRAEIAHRLQLSPHTVRTHLAAAMDKLGVHSQLAAAARTRELLDVVDDRQPPARAAGDEAG